MHLILSAEVKLDPHQLRIRLCYVGEVTGRQVSGQRSISIRRDSEDVVTVSVEHWQNSMVFAHDTFKFQGGVLLSSIECGVEVHVSKMGPVRRAFIEQTVGQILGELLGLESLCA